MLAQMEDTGLAPAPTGGPAASFDAFYAATAPRLVRQLHAMTGDLADAPDCVQEACARAWQRWNRLEQYDVPEAWVRTVAWNLAVSRARRVRTAARALVRSAAPADVHHQDGAAALPSDS